MPDSQGSTTLRTSAVTTGGVHGIAATRQHGRAGFGGVVVLLGHKSVA